MTPTEQTCRLSGLRRPLLYAVALQIVFLTLAAMILDGGYCGRICMAAIVGYWLTVGWIALRRRDALTKTDVVLIRSGFFLWLAVAVLVAIGLEYAAFRFIH